MIARVPPIHARLRKAKQRVDSMTAREMRQARRRACMAAVREYENAGLTRSAAVAIAAAQFDVSARTVWRWLEDFFDKPMEER